VVFVAGHTIPTLHSSLIIETPLLPNPLKNKMKWRLNVAGG